MGGANRAQRAVLAIHQRSAQRRPHDVGPLVEVQAEHGAAQCPEGQRVTGVIEVDVGAVGPAAGNPRRGLGHVSGELRDVVFGEDRLQCPPAGQPRVVGQVEEIPPQRATNFPIARQIDFNLPALSLGFLETENIGLMFLEE